MPNLIKKSWTVSSRSPKPNVISVILVMDTDEGCLKPPEAENETETALKTAQNYTSGEIRMSNQNLLAEQAQYIC